jgi:hypothetical protein
MDRQRTLGTSNVAVAALVTSLYPVFPTHPTDNLFHLQMFRFLWCLGVENRCLSVHDAVTGELVPASVEVAMKDEVRPSVLCTSPCLLPPLEWIKELRINSPAYFPMNVPGSNSITTSVLRVFVQPGSQDAVAATTWLARNLTLLNRHRTALDGWCLALLALTAGDDERVVSALVAVDRVFASSTASLRAHYAESKWPDGSAQEARDWHWIMAASAMPALGQVCVEQLNKILACAHQSVQVQEQLLGSKGGAVESALQLATRLGGGVSWQCCQALFQWLPNNSTVAK